MPPWTGWREALERCTAIKEDHCKAVQKKLQKNYFGFGDKFNSFQKWKFPKDRQRVRTGIGISAPAADLLLLCSKVIENN